MPRMYKSQALSMMLIVFWLAPAAAQVRLPVMVHPKADEVAVKDLVRRYVESRDTGDQKMIASIFTPDADQLVSSGEWRKGKDAVVAGTVASSKREKGQKRTIVVESIRFIDDNVAIADGRYTLSGQGEERKMWTSIIAKRTPEGWRIAAIRNMLPAPPAR